MPRFFIEPTDAREGGSIMLSGEDARHIARVLRMRPSEAITLCDGVGFDYRCEIAAVEPDSVEARVLQKLPNETEPAVRIRLYQALPKGEKLDFIVQKAVELGAFDIVPVLTEHCVSRPDAKSMDKKTARLQKIALEAAKQSGRGIIPRILPLQKFEQAISGMKTAGRAILLYERASSPLSSFLRNGMCDIALMVGSEGGFSPEEAALAEREGIAMASLGRRILRCETAPVCALSAVLYAQGEF